MTKQQPVVSPFEDRVDEIMRKQLPAATEHSLRSSYREALLEHLFVGEVMKHLWLKGVSIEVLKPQVDDAGYDLVLEVAGVVRHVQLKSSHSRAKTARVNVSLDLRNKPGGCVIWLWFNPETLHFEKFLWFGNAPGERLSEIANFKIAKHTKGNAQGFKAKRQNLRVIPKGDFTPVETIDKLVLKLFGPPQLP
jgi:hypothetical protein